VTGTGFFFTLENVMSDNTKIAIGLIVGAPMAYFMLVVLMSF
jgi:Ca2+/Na+ antiporter